VIHGKADFLLTGDVRHFDHLYGKRIEGVLVVRPAEYFGRRRRTLRTAFALHFRPGLLTDKFSYRSQNPPGRVALMASFLR
jgi:hypothetical protein